jgi:hypothetical protein
MAGADTLVFDGCGGEAPDPRCKCFETDCGWSSGSARASFVSLRSRVLAVARQKVPVPPGTASQLAERAALPRLPPAARSVPDSLKAELPPQE